MWAAPWDLAVALAVCAGALVAELSISVADWVTRGLSAASGRDGKGKQHPRPSDKVESGGCLLLAARCLHRGHSTSVWGRKKSSKKPLWVLHSSEAVSFVV